MNAVLEQQGYAFGKALETMNADPEHYAHEIMAGLDLSQQDQEAIYAGCQRALAEIPADKLAANLVNHVRWMMDMTEEQGASPWIDEEAEAFDIGLRSILKAWMGEYAPKAPRSMSPDEQAAFERGREIGQQIMSAWEEASKGSANAAQPEE